MISRFYLVVNKNGTLRTTKTQPSLRWDEISIRMQLKLPSALFQRPFLSAEINVDEKDIATKVIEPEVINNIEKAIKEHTGNELKISIIDNSNEKG